MPAAHVVAHVIGNGGGVPGIILGDAGLHLAHQVRAHVGGLGVDAAAHSGEQGHKGGTHTVHDHDVAQRHRVIHAKGIAQQEEPHSDIQHPQANHGKAHDRAGGERHPQALVQALGGGLGGTGIGVGRNLHADEARQHGEDAAGDKGEGGELGEHLSAGGEGQDQQDDKHHHKDLEYRCILLFQVSVCAGADVGRDLPHPLGALGVGHYLPGLHDREEPGHNRADESDPKQVFHTSTPFALLLGLA